MRIAREHNRHSIRAILRAGGRGLFWGLPAASSEIAGWRASAEAIPDRALRADALHSLSTKRDNVEGASMFCILPKQRNRQLVRLLTTYQVLWDLLDTISERETSDADRRQLHLALTDALDPDVAMADYYAHHAGEDDGGYLASLVQTCRAICATLPSYAQIRPAVLAGMRGVGDVQTINNDPALAHCGEALRAWTERQAFAESELSWFELAAAASTFLPYPLFALAAEPACADSDVDDTLQVYFPPFSLAVAMLDSYADRVQDTVNAHHSCISQYVDADVAVERLCAVIDQVTHQVRKLPDGERHALLVATMVTMYLSRPGARTPDVRAPTRLLADAGGPLSRLLLPLAIAWRGGWLTPGSPSSRPRANARARSSLPGGPRLPKPIQTVMLWKSPLTFLERCRQRYGNTFAVTATSRPPLVCISDPVAVREVLTAPCDLLHPGEGASTVAPLVGSESFMLLDEAAHLHGRRLILPPLRLEAVARKAEIVQDVAEREVASWPQGVPFALHPRLRTLTLETALRTGLGVSGANRDSYRLELHDKLLRMLSVTGSAVFPEPLLRHGHGRRIWERFLNDREEVDELLYALIGDADSSAGSCDSVFDALLLARGADGSALTATQVRDNFMSIALAGHETTAVQLAWAFQLLAHHPNVLDKLTEEIDAGDSDAYLTASIHEVLRHRPAFLFTIPREVKRPTEIGGHLYEPPAQLLACTYLLHHDPEIYPDPYAFRPERFLEAQPPPGAWWPWGGGRRRCPGRHLATVEMKIVLRTVLTTMTVRPASSRIEDARWRSVIVTPAHGSTVVLHPRRRSSARSRAAMDDCEAARHRV
jgi:cytochrome P450